MQTAGATLAKDSRLIGEWTGFCSADINDTSEEENKFITYNQFNVLISEALKDYTKNVVLEESQSKQDKLIQKLQSNMINESTEEATSLYVEDASDLPAVLTIEGNHYQETQEGTDNLAVLNEGSITQDGITVSVQNGVATVSGTNTNNEATYITIGTAYLYANKTYYLRKEQGTAIGGYSLYKNGQAKWFEATGESSIEVSETGEWSVRYSVGANASVSGTLKFGVYENAETEYVVGKKAVPSVEYPSPVRAVGDNVNMFNVWESGTISNSGNIESSDIAIRTADFISVKSNTSYTYKIYDETISNIALFEYDENSNFIKVMYNLNTEQTIVTSETTRKVKMRIVSTDLSTKMKFEEGTEATSYSPYGQGSVEVRKLTENVIDLSKAIALYNTEITEIDEENGVIKVHRTNTQDPSIQIFCNLPAGQYTMLHNSHNFGQVSVYEKNKIVDIGSEKYKIFNATENITDIRIYSESELPTDYEINFSDIILVAGNVPREDIKYTKYQEQSYILDIQKPMLLGDYFVKEADGWKEVHIWNKLIFTGQENWNNSGASTDEIFVATLDIENGVDGYGYSNYFKYWGGIKISYFSVYNNGVNIRFCMDGAEIKTIEEFKAWLQQKNTEGNPVCVYYRLATPTKLDLTEEQKEVLQQLNNLDLYKGTNNIYTDQDLALLQLDYIVDTKMYIDNKIANLKEQVNTTNELLSTTGTSAMLLDNLQNDLESEVM